MKPMRHPGYLQWIRTLPCSVCQTTRAVEAAHTGPHGLSQKSSDLSAIPLCVTHHRTGDDSYHKLGPRKFAEVHQLNIRAIVWRLSAKPFIRVEMAFSWAGSEIRSSARIHGGLGSAGDSQDERTPAGDPRRKLPEVLPSSTSSRALGHDFRHTFAFRKEARTFSMGIRKRALSENL